jgi:pSer/pThr/pTyr-binding forkhead associated (FHA) protein
LHLSIREITATQGAAAKPKMIETSRLTPAHKIENEPLFRYFLVPQNKMSERTYLTKTSTVLGRDPTADVVIDNTDVSWRHCLLDIQTRGVFIRDLDSTNGTYVNTILVRDGQVNPGDRIELGPYSFTLNREAIGVR